MLLSEKKSIIKSASIISFATLCSRLLGFVRDIVIAAFFGTGLSSEAFFVAFRISNLLRELVGEGAANSAFVPVFSEYRIKEKKEDFWNLVSNTFWLILAVLFGVSVLGILFSRSIVSLIGFGFLKEPEKFLLTTQLTRILFPYLLLIGVAAYVMGLLHTFKSFTAPAFSPCLLNICMIVSIWVASGIMSEPIFGLAVGVLIGGFCQIAIQLPFLFKQGFRFSFLKINLAFACRGRVLHPGVQKISQLLFPRLFGAAVYQVNILIDTVLATLSSIVGQGAVAAIHFANHLVQLPLALFGIALSSAILPTLSVQAASQDIKSLRQTLNFSLRTVYFLLLPATLGLLMLTQPLIRILFQRGHFDYYSVQITSSALFFYAIGLVFWSGMKILIAGFYSLQDTRTPVLIAALGMLVNLLLNIILMFPLKVGGLALASSLSAGFSLFLLYLSLIKKIGPIFTRDFYIYFLKISTAGLGMTAFITIFFYKAAFYLNPVLKLLLTILLASLVYFGTCFFLKVNKKLPGRVWIK